MNEISYHSFYHRLFEQAKFGFIVSNFEGQILDVNPFCCSLLEIDREQMLRLTLYDFVPDNLLLWETPDKQSIKNGETIVRERRILKKSGEYILVESHIQIIDENQVLILIHDITARDKALKISEERLHTLINSSPDIICFKDAEGRWMQVNESILDHYGLTGVDYKGKTEFELADYTAPMFQDAFRNCQGTDDLAWEQGKTSRVVENIPDVGGSIHVFDVVKVPLYYPDGTRKGIVVFGRDITDIKKAENALRDSEEKYRQIAEQTSDVIWMMNIGMQYTYVSPSIFRQRGYTPKEFMSLRPEDIYPPESLEKVVDIYRMGQKMANEESVPPGFSVTAEIQHYCKDGSIRDSEVLISPLFDSAGNLAGGHGVSRDITFRKNTEKTNRILVDFQSLLLKIDLLNEVHELVVQTVHDLLGEGIVFSTNIDQYTGIGKIFAHKGLEVPRNRLTQALGLDPFEMEFYMKDITENELKLYQSRKFEEFPGGLYELATRRFPKILTLGVEKMLKIKKIYTLGYIYHDLHLGGFIVLCQKDLSAYAGTIEMIVNQAAISMNRIKAEISLKEAEERFRLAFQTSPDAVNINDLKTGRYIEVNEGFCSITGYSKEEVIGKSSLELNIWANPAERAKMIEILKRNGKVVNFEAVFRFKDGTCHTGLMSAAVINLNGIPHIISISHDIEELKQAGQAILHAKEVAEEASRLKTAFLNNISHEVRTPMNAILGFTELLQSDEFEQHEKERFFSIISSNSKQLLSIIDDVLEISRMDSGRIPYNPTGFSLRELMDDIHISMSEMVTKRGLAFYFDFNQPACPDLIVSDREKIRQVITGFIGNAIKFTPNGTINFGYRRLAEDIEFYVHDTGIGIPLEEQGKIFDRFYQVNHEPTQGIRGTGLGLSIASGLAEVMNGSIRLESTPGAGSIFFLTIPFREQKPSVHSVENEKPFSMDVLTILVAEDEDNNFELLEILLAKRIKKIIRATNGKEVLAILEKQKPDLILMDLKMPVMDGYEATRQAKALFPDLRIIALTAYTQPEEERRALEAGCAAFISKPIRNQELYETIRRSIRN